MTRRRRALQQRWSLPSSIYVVIALFSALSLFPVSFAASSDSDETCDASSSDGSTDQSCVVASAETKKTLSVPALPPVVNDYVDVGYGEPQQVGGTQEQQELTLEWMQQSHEYMHTQVLSPNGSLFLTRRFCLNEHELCSFWASLNECESNPNYMKKSCAPACRSCDQKHFKTRCPMPENKEQFDIFKEKGQLDAMFRRIVDDPQYKTRVIYREGDPNELVGKAPWIIIVDDFLKPEECLRLQELGAEQGYKLSEDVGTMKPDGTYGSQSNDGRTSTNAWCLDDCYKDPVTTVVLEKLENLTGIPDSHAEYLQLLRYEPGQYYQPHHDFIDHNVHRMQGPRILTVFIYLNTVEAGGGTKFVDLNVTVAPVEGSALIWPSVKDGHYNRRDDRTHHEALPVERGIKFGANAWYHLRDFKTPHAEDCI